MPISKLSGDEQGILFLQLRNVLDPDIAVAWTSVSNELRMAMQALLPQLKTDHEVATALCLKLGHRSCKALREAEQVFWYLKGLTTDEFALLGTLGSMLPALKWLYLCEPAAGPNGMQQLAEGLGAGALPALTSLWISDTYVGDAGASTLAAALGQGALPRLKDLSLYSAAIGDAGLVALAPALRRRPSLELLSFFGNPLGDEGLAALLAPPPPAGAPPPTTGLLVTELMGLDLVAKPPRTGVLAKLETLDLWSTQITDAGCAALAAALESGALPALKTLYLSYIPASAAAVASVYAARETLDEESGSESETDEVEAA